MKENLLKLIEFDESFCRCMTTMRCNYVCYFFLCSSRLYGMILLACLAAIFRRHFTWFECVRVNEKKYKAKQDALIIQTVRHRSTKTMIHQLTFM